MTFEPTISGDTTTDTETRVSSQSGSYRPVAELRAQTQHSEGMRCCAG